MHRWVFRFLCLIASVIVGFAIGYAALSLRAIAMSPMGLNLAKRTDPFERVFVEMTRLEEAERVLGACKNTSAPSSQKASLRVESELIAGLRTDAKASGFAPPLDVAEAILEQQQRFTQVSHGKWRWRTYCERTAQALRMA
jgi:hypothetical protein